MPDELVLLPDSTPESKLGRTVPSARYYCQGPIALVKLKRHTGYGELILRAK